MSKHSAYAWNSIIWGDKIQLKMSRVKLSIVMPCLNEALTLGACIDDAKNFLKKKRIGGEIIIVDNGSTDGSAKIAKKHGARLIEEKRRGYGRALRTGFEASRGEYIIMGDCDTTYNFRHMSRMWKLLQKSDFVIGNRLNEKMEPGALSFVHRIGVKVLSFLGRVRYKTDVQDFHCGLRGFRKAALGTKQFKTTGMEFATEMVALAVKNKLKIRQLDIKYHKSVKGRKSKLRTVRDGLRHLDYLAFGGLNKTWQRICRCGVILLASIIGGLGLLWLVSQIPRSAIHDHTKESAEYYLSFGEMKPDLIEGSDNTKRDFYADSIWLSIAYGYDGSLSSVISSKYAYIDGESAGENLHKQVQGELEANKDYSRYWHGSLVLVRPLLTVLNIRQIYILNTVIIIALMLTIALLLILHKEHAGAVVFSASMISALIFFAGTSLEFAQAIILMELISIAAMYLVWKKKRKNLPYLMFFAGIVVNYLDFLTAETLTLTIPLLLVLWLRRRKKMDFVGLEKYLYLIVYWLAGYCLMWISKWLIALIALGGGTLGDLGNQMGLRSFKSEIGLSIIEMLIQAFKLNIGFLLPFSINDGVSIVCAITLVVALILNLENMKEKLNLAWLLAVIMLGAVPILRTFVMIEHEWSHAFFTYRAFGATLMSVLMIIFAASERRKEC